MLVLSRKRSESIRIGDNITITIADIRGDKVRIGITAPDEVGVHRQEVYDAIKSGEKVDTPRTKKPRSKTKS
jgi:carbon storage regulator